MVNKPKARGTAAETIVVNHLVERGWPYAERRSLQGSLDKGDVTGTPGLCWEVKCADRSFQFSKWLNETEAERRNARADFGVLVCKPPGYAAARIRQWIAAMRAEEFYRLVDASKREPATFQSSQVKNTLAVVRELRVLKANFPDMAPMVTYQPPGLVNHPGLWYVCVYLETMIDMLHEAGYGQASDLAQSS